MNKPSKSTKAYSVVVKDGAYQIVEFVITDGKVTSIKEINTADVLPITLGQINTLFRKDLGL